MSQRRFLVVDDEPLVREDVRFLLRDAGFSDRPPLEADNGARAYELIRRHRPDVALVDIRMPDMDGLELMAKLSEEKLPVKLIVISGYADFEYVRAALRCGAVDYLLKPIDEQAFRRAVSRTLEKLDREEERQGRVQADLGPRLAIWLRGMLERAEVQKMEAGDIQRDLGWSQLGLANYRACLGLMLAASAEEELPAGGAPVSLNALVGLEGEEEGCVAVVAQRSNLVAVVGYDACANPPERNARQRVEQRILRLIEHTGQVNCFFAVEDEPAGFEQLGAMYERCSDALARRFYAPDHCQRLAPVRGQGAPSEDLERAVELCVESLQRLMSVPAYSRLLGDAGRTILHLMHSEVMERASYRQLEQAYARLARTIVERCYAGEGLERLERAPVSPERMLGYFSGMSQLVNYLLDLLARRQVPGALPYDLHSAMRAIKAHLDAHFREPLSLTQVAAQFGLNPNYLSTAFHDDLGIGFVDYVTKLRVEYAQTLLRTTDMSAAAITELAGFSTPSYFQRVFKKRVGMTPQEYRKASIRAARGRRE